MQRENRLEDRRFVRRALAAVAVLSAAALAFADGFSPFRDRPFATLAVAAVAGAAAFHPRLSWIVSAAGRLAMRPSPRRFGWFLFVAGTVSCAALSWILFAGLPVLDDDVAALFQARIFLSGRLWIPSPEPIAFFHNFGMLSSLHGLDHMCAMYPFGHPLLLAPFAAAGVPWLAMPVFGGGVCALAASVGRILFGERCGRLAGLLCLSSPMFLEVCSTHLCHAPTAFGILLALRGILLCLEKPDARQGLLAGLGLAVAFLCRPATAAALGLSLGLFAAARPAKAWRAVRPLAAAAAVLAVAVALHVLYTQGQTGDWRRAGHAVALEWLGLGGYGFSPRFGPAAALRNSAMRLSAFAAKATGWPVPALLPALLPLLRRGTRRRAALLWTALPLLVAVYHFFFYFEWCLPGRYLFCALPFVLVLAAAGCEEAARALGVPLSRLVAIPASCALFVFLPARFSSFDDHFWDVEKTLPRVVEAAGLRNALVFYDDIGTASDRAGEKNLYFATAFMRNDLDFRGDVVYAVNRKEANAELAAAFPGRTFYLYRYRRDVNLSELYREEFDPATGVARHVFLPLDIPGYVRPGTVEPSIPGASVGEPRPGAV
ncbi:MAG: glycosyltransferase family 39 protein, partial [Kiritimatiellae bacterium]|nr:glycosyltransferase family 39 protein [Kiritimatiellia bacterium]